MLYKFLIHNLADTKNLAIRIAGVIVPNLVITLNGNLGVGKTTLTRFILHALGVSEVIKSPTFTLVEAYHLSNFTVYHFDLYRFSDPEEWFDAGFDEYFDQPHLCLIEWADKASCMLPTIDWELTLDWVDEQIRHLTITTRSRIGEKCLNNLIHSGVV